MDLDFLALFVDAAAVAGVKWLVQGAEGERGGRVQAKGNRAASKGSQRLSLFGGDSWSDWFFGFVLNGNGNSGHPPPPPSQPPTAARQQHYQQQQQRTMTKMFGLRLLLVLLLLHNGNKLPRHLPSRCSGHQGANPCHTDAIQPPRLRHLVCFSVRAFCFSLTTVVLVVC